MDLLSILITGFVVIMLFVGVRFQKHSKPAPKNANIIIIIRDK